MTIYLNVESSYFADVIVLRHGELVSVVFPNADDATEAIVEITFRNGTSFLTVSVTGNSVSLSENGDDPVLAHCNFPANPVNELWLMYDETGLALGPPESVCIMPYSDILQAETLSVIFKAFTDISSSKGCVHFKTNSETVVL